MIDIVGSCQTKEIDFDEWIQRRTLLQRQFTVMAITEIEVLFFSIQDLNRMKLEFFDCYEKLLNDALQLLRQTWQAKLNAMHSCRKQQKQN